jgi:hypothetical protein
VRYLRRWRFAGSDKKKNVGQYISNALMGFYLVVGFSMIPALQVGAAAAKSRWWRLRFDGVSASLVQALTVVKERETKAKQMQLIMGMSVSSYWVSIWLWDVVQYSVPWIGSCILVYGFGGSAFHVRTSCRVVVLLSRARRS